MSLHYGIAHGKYRNPFLTIQTSKRTIVFEIHTCLSCFFKFRKMTDKKSVNFWHVNLSILTITNFGR